jgi:thermospermine synthase
MGGGEGATAREVLRHKTVERVVMVDIDEVVCRFCAEHLEDNTAAFKDPRLTLVHDDAGAQLENWDGTFDVIISDLADPVYGGPCYHLYTQDFYRNVVAKKLNPGGVFIAQAGPAGVLSHHEVFTSIHRTIQSAFPNVHPYHAHFPSFCDEWGFSLAFTDPAARRLTPEEFDRAAAERVTGELRFVDGGALAWLFSFSKVVRKALESEQHIFTKDNPKFLAHGKGIQG